MTQSTFGASTQTGEPTPCGNMGNTVRFKWTALNPGTITADTFFSNFDTVLAAYRGTSLSNLQNVACNDDGGGSGTSSLSFNAVGGTTYHFQVGGYNGATGNAKFDLQCSSCNTPPPPNPPGNINRADAYTISTGSRSQSTANADLESGEQRPCGNIDSTVWFKHSSLVPRVASVNTYGSNFDTVLAVYVDVGGVLVSLGCNDESQGSQSKVDFNVLPGLTYYIQAGGYYGAEGNLQLSLS